eukprot:CAMPEP_0170601758 /NCGR_PEP_ID=MMETSP0224-20130122/18029_1 /TAXON_ID=285029 /ORGANISM="Togula jolla, Strain CCCM 725" /LENGTH=91 /DNA_ID=CAMNT_0010926553 /DNA_START=136 /DNA_END=411 /DNA_ORIENTATION=-
MAPQCASKYLSAKPEKPQAIKIKLPSTPMVTAEDGARQANETCEAAAVVAVGQVLGPETIPWEVEYMVPTQESASMRTHTPRAEVQLPGVA